MCIYICNHENNDLAFVRFEHSVCRGSLMTTCIYVYVYIYITCISLFVCIYIYMRVLCTCCIMYNMCTCSSPLSCLVALMIPYRTKPVWCCSEKVR